MQTPRSSSSPRFSWPVFIVAWGSFFAVTLAWNIGTRDSFQDLPAHWNIDGVFYDNIAVNLSQGRGFVVDFEQTQWRHGYEQANEATGPAQFYKWVIQFEGSGPTTMRSPGYPYVLSIIYRCFGWRHDVVRYAGLLFASLGVALMIEWCCRRFGYLVSLIAGLTIMVDYSVMQTAGMVASEPLAVLVFSFSFVTLASLADRPSYGRAVVGGLAFAGLFLTRGNWNLGLLLIVATTPLLAFSGIRAALLPIKIQHVGVALLTAIVLATPWWIRNCQTTGHFQPFGSAGACGMVAAYCDESLADYGNWKSGVFHRNQQAVFREIDFDNTPLAHREFLVGRSSMEQAVDWAFSNWYSLPQLAFFRYLSHWGMFNSAVPSALQVLNAFWLILGLNGCLFLSGRQKTLIGFVLLIDALIVMLTWAHLGRYGIPIRPLLHIGCALSIVRFWQYVLIERQQNKPPEKP